MSERERSDKRGASETSKSPRSTSLRGDRSDKKGRGRRILLRFARTILPILILVLAGGTFVYLSATKPAVKRKPVTERVWYVDTITAEPTTVSPRLVLYGTIVAGREVELRPLVTGRVVRVGKTFAEGGLVKKGDELVVIDSFEYTATLDDRKAQLSEAEARLVQLRADFEAEKRMLDYDVQQIAVRKRELERRRDLNQRGSGTQKSLDDALWALTDQQQRHSERRKRITSLNAQIDQQKAVITRMNVAVRRAERDLRDTVLKAPFDAFLRDISTAVGKRIGVGDKVAHLTDARALEVEFQVTDAQYGRLVADGSVVGKQATVIWKTRDKSFKFPAAIKRVSGRVAVNEGGINLFARLAGTNLDTVLRPGVFVEVRITDTPYANVVRLPDEAVQGDNTIYVVEGDRLSRRKISVIGRVRNDVLVRGALKAGERVVARPFPEIGPGVKVRVQ